MKVQVKVKVKVEVMVKYKANSAKTNIQQWHDSVFGGIFGMYSRLSFNSAACLFIFEMIFLPTCSY